VALLLPLLLCVLRLLMAAVAAVERVCTRLLRLSAMAAVGAVAAAVSTLLLLLLLGHLHGLAVSRWHCRSRSSTQAGQKVVSVRGVAKGDGGGELGDGRHLGLLCCLLLQARPARCSLGGVEAGEGER
jgi:uncharacterized membrane protein YhaH (DUF805 family)